MELNELFIWNFAQMTGEQGKCMTLAQVRLLSRMTDSTLTPAKDPNYSSGDGDRPPLGHLSGLSLVPFRLIHFSVLSVVYCVNKISLHIQECLIY